MHARTSEAWLYVPAKKKVSANTLSVYRSAPRRDHAIQIWSRNVNHLRDRRRISSFNSPRILDTFYLNFGPTDIENSFSSFDSSSNFLNFCRMLMEFKDVILRTRHRVVLSHPIVASDTQWKDFYRMPNRLTFWRRSMQSPLAIQSLSWTLRCL